MKTKSIICTQCKKPFTMLLKHYNYNIVKFGRNPFCGNSCHSTYKNLHRSKESYKNNALHLNPGNKKDGFSPFRAFLRNCMTRKRDVGRDVNIDLPYLKDLWNNQKGICPYTGMTMILPETTNDYNSNHSLEKASLDRIDSSKGYIKGNVEFVCLFINLAKNNHPKQEMMNIISKIKGGQDAESCNPNF